MKNDYLDLIEYVQIEVKFDESGRTYTYLHTDRGTFEEGDYAVVYARSELKVVEVVEVKDEAVDDTSIAYKWIIDKVDMDKYQRLLNRISQGKKQ